MHEDYLMPQENGSHYNCNYLKLDGCSGGIEVSGEGFCFNASEYTQEELTEKAHNFELEKCGRRSSASTPSRTASAPTAAVRNSPGATVRRRTFTLSAR